MTSAFVYRITVTNQGAAEALEDGLWQVVLGADATGAMPEGSSRLDVMVVSELVGIPRVVSYDFVTAQ